MIDARAARRRSTLLLWLCAFGLLAFLTWERELFDADEGRYASVAHTMWATGDWVVPRLDDMPFMDKPPLVYWVQAAAYTAFGPAPFLARLPTVLAGSLWCLLLFLLARRLSGSEGVAWTVGLVAATSTAGIVGSRVGPQMDMPLAAAVAGAIYAAYAGLVALERTNGRGPGLAPQLGLGAAVGLGLLAAGPLVIGVPLLVAGGWCLAGVPWRATLRIARSPIAWLFALAIAAPWYVLVERAMPGWTAHFLSSELLGRFREGDFRDVHPVWLYVPVVLIYLAPWTPLAFAPVAAGPGRWRRLRSMATTSPWSPRPWDHALTRPGLYGVRAGRLLYLWFLIGFLLYSVSTRKPFNALLPAAGPLFVLAGARLHALLGSRSRLPFVLPLGIGIAALVAGLLIQLRLWLPLATGRLPTQVDAPRWAGMGPLVALAGGLLIAATWLAHRRRDAGRLACAPVLIGGAALFWIALDAALAHGDHLGSAQAVARAIEGAAGPDTPVLASTHYPQGLAWYTPRRVWIGGDREGDVLQRDIVRRYAEDARRTLTYDATGAPRWTGTGNVLTSAELRAVWRRPERALLLCRWAEVAHFRGRIVGGPFAGAGRTDLFLLENRP